MGKYFLRTQKIFWDQWARGPILFPPLILSSYLDMKGKCIIMLSLCILCLAKYIFKLNTSCEVCIYIGKTCMHAVVDALHFRQSLQKNKWFDCMFCDGNATILPPVFRIQIVIKSYSANYITM